MIGIHIIIAAMTAYPYVVTISSEKGGVGKTTLATNLAIFLKALDENLPVTIFSFDNHFTVDKMFEIKGQLPKGDVADFLCGVPGAELLHTGQYGVSYIPSSRSLNDLKQSVKGTLMLARLLAKSDIPGVLIIDTRPDLDLLTQNALFAADRAIIPVKDMASLENCRNIFELFDKKGFDKKSLALVPCIIDSRIKFDGPFQDQRSLLKAYAINRGYRCLDTYISKSPKVESLSTNPGGKVLPVLTHARNTEVFGQFTQLATTVLDGLKATRSPRSLLFHDWLIREEERNEAAYAERRKTIRPDCLFCKRPYQAATDFSYYFESSDGNARGFLEDQCFSDLLLTAIFNMGAGMPLDDPKRLMLREATRGSSFAFRPTGGESGSMVEFSRYDNTGALILKRLYSLGNGNSSGTRCGLTTLLEETVSHDNLAVGKDFVVVHPVDATMPEGILREESYREFARQKWRIAEQI